MEHTEKYLQAKWVTENPNGYDVRGLDADIDLTDYEFLERVS